MGKFTNKILAEFQPPKKWKLGRDLVYTTSDLYANEVKALKDVGVEIVRDTNKTETITVPSGFITDLASTPRILWNVLHHLMLQERLSYMIYCINQSDNTDGQKV